MRVILVGIARMGSSRFPGKVLADLGGKPVLEWIVDAAWRARLVDDIVIATTTESRDDTIVKWCEEYGVSVFRGSEDDVLGRFYDAAKFMEADVAIRVTCDCPFVDPHVIDQVVALREATKADYAGNIDPPTWPDGLDCEAIEIYALRTAHLKATSKIDRECVTTYITSNRALFKCESLVCPLPGMHKERWVLDTREDYKLCQAIAANPMGHGWLEIKRFLDKPSNHNLRRINTHQSRNERLYEAMANEPFVSRSYQRSKKLLERAEKTIPLAAQTYSKSKIQYPSDSPLFVTHGDGGYVYDVDGHRYVDLVGSLLPVILGHRDPDVDDAIRRQLNRGISFSLSTKLEAQLSETLCRLIPCAEMVRFGKNGSDVTSAAVRLARAHTGRDYIISSGYHGWHDWAVANDEVRNLGVPHQQVIPLRHGDLSLLNSRDDGIAAVIVEPETNPEFLKQCRKFCDNTGALLIFDEIITGFRFDLGGAQKVHGVTPDLACFGKSMANGMPVSALVGKREYMQMMEKTSYSGTFFGETLSIAAAIATIDKLEREDVLPQIYKRNLLLWEEVMAYKDETEEVFECTTGLQLEGSRFLPRIKFLNNDVKTLFIQKMAQCGVLIIASHNLSFAHGKNELDRVLRAYEHVLPILAEAIKTDTVKDRIKGRSIPEHANVRRAG